MTIAYWLTNHSEPLLNYLTLQLLCLPQQLPFGEIPQKTLVMAVYDFDRFSKHDQIGQVVIPLSSIDLCESIEDTKDLTSPDDEKVG